MPLQNLNITVSAYLTDQFPDPDPHLSTQYRFPILGHPYQMQVDLKNCMCPMTIAHALRLTPHHNALKLSPEGEGFNPPKVRQ